MEFEIEMYNWRADKTLMRMSESLQYFSTIYLLFPTAPRKATALVLEHRPRSIAPVAARYL
jgi:hypothetical protein